MDKKDYKKEFNELYNPPKKNPVFIEVPEFQFLMIDGMGIVESKDYQNAVETLFGVSYKSKFIIKKEKNFDYGVMPLEGLWWAEDMNDFIKGNKEKWKWTMMIMQPECVTEEIINRAKNDLKEKKKYLPVDKIIFKSFTEGHAAQMMHIGPYSEEHENIMKIHNYIEENGGKFNGKINKHHEIYLNIPGRTTPEKLKTVLRQSFIK